MDDLYREQIIDRYKNPRSRGTLDPHDFTYEDDNPLCGDRVKVFARLDGDQLGAVGFEGSGCAISTAAASLMTQVVKGKTRQEVEALYRRYHEMVTGAADADPSLGKLEVLAGVRAFPARVKCATLVWHALRAALEGQAQPVSTEE